MGRTARASAAAAAGAHSGPTTSTGDTAVDPGLSPIAVHTEGSTVVLAVVDRLDEVAGGALLDAASEAVASDPERIEVDLRFRLGRRKGQRFRLRNC